jgi:hypothetical protein
MIYKFTLVSDESDNFLRLIEVDSEATFFDLHNVIVSSVKYKSNEMASFFLCSDHWEKKQEITLVEMESSSEYDNYVMENTKLDELISEEGQKLLYVFDVFWERAFYVKLIEIIVGKTLQKARCIKSEGNAPVQIKKEEAFSLQDKLTLDTEFYGDSEFDIDELDEEGFSDLDFNGDVSIDNSGL